MTLILALIVERVHDELKIMIEKYFQKQYQDGCDYRLAHFVSQEVLKICFMRMSLINDRHKEKNFEKWKPLSKIMIPLSKR